MPCKKIKVNTKNTKIADVSKSFTRLFVMYDATTTFTHTPETGILPPKYSIHVTISITRKGIWSTLRFCTKFPKKTQ